MRFIPLLLGLVFAPTLWAQELWEHLSDDPQWSGIRGLSAKFDASGDRRILHLDLPALNLATGESGSNPRKGIAWVAIPPPSEGWKLERSSKVEASVRNTGSGKARITLWVVSSHGWEAVGAAAELVSGQTEILSADLRETFPDRTPKIDPGNLEEIRIMIQGAARASVEISGLVARGTADAWVRPPGRLEVPAMVEGKPAPGRRVRYRLAGDANTRIYGSLYLPSDWQPGKRYPVIAEYPGNIFFTPKACWSTGRPEQCVMGYGISSGTGALWISLPFVDREKGEIAEAGFGSNEGADTAAYALAAIDDLCAQWGGDRNNLFLCGFSRGAIACGYIGLRNDHIAGLWKGFIACQHYDGSRWRQSNMKEAVARAPRFQGEAILQIDNPQEKYQPVVDATDPSVHWIWLRSGLNFHSTAMFLDNRDSTLQVRRWFLDRIQP